MKITEVLGTETNKVFVYYFRYDVDLSDLGGTPRANLEEGPIEVDQNGKSLKDIAKEHNTAAKLTYTLDQGRALSASMDVHTQRHRGAIPKVVVNVTVVTETEMMDNQIHQLENNLSSELEQYVEDTVSDFHQSQDEHDYPYSSRGLSKSDFY